MPPTRVRTPAAALALLAATAVIALAVAPGAAAGAPAGDDLAGALDGTTDLVLDNDSDATLSVNGSASAGGDDTVNASLDADATVGDDATVDADASSAVDADDGSAVEAGVSATADVDGTTLEADASTDAGVSPTAGGLLADADGDAVAGENDSGAGPPPGSDAGGDGGLPAPEEAGAGLVAGSLLVGGGLLGRRAVEASLATGGSGGSVPSAALAWLRAWGWRLLALAGYHRLEETDPLQHETRAAVYEHLERSPGAFLTEVSEETGVPLSTLRYHLRVLEYEGLVASAKVRGKRRYVPADVDLDALAPALDDEATAAVLEALAEAPDSVSGLADRLGRDPSTVCHHLQRLDDEGLVERERDGRSVVNRLADGLDPTAVVAATAGVATGRAD